MALANGERVAVNFRKTMQEGKWVAWSHLLTCCHGPDVESLGTILRPACMTEKRVWAALLSVAFLGPTSPLHGLLTEAHVQMGAFLGLLSRTSCMQKSCQVTPFSCDQSSQSAGSLSPFRVWSLSFYEPS